MRLFIVIHAQIVCEIDIRTLTSHQVLGQILDQIFDQIFDQVLGQILDQIFDQVLAQILDQIFDQVLDQGFWSRKDSVQFHWDGEIQCTVLLGQKNTVYSTSATENSGKGTLLTRGAY